jgi:hypothetical protein
LFQNVHWLLGKLNSLPHKWEYIHNQYIALRMEVTTHCSAMLACVDVFRWDHTYLVLIAQFMKLTSWRITHSAVSMNYLTETILT